MLLLIESGFVVTTKIAECIADHSRHGTRCIGTRLWRSSRGASLYFECVRHMN